MNRISLLLYLALCISPAWAQNQYWIVFEDKPVFQGQPEELLSPAALEKRRLQGLPEVQWTDLPLNSQYIRQLVEQQIRAQQVSKWLNAVAASLSKEQLEWVKKQPYVREVVEIRTRSIAQRKGNGVINYGMAITQLGAEAADAAGLDGQGILIGVIDAGFASAASDMMLQDIFVKQRVVSTMDLVNRLRSADEFYEAETSNDEHGTTVMQMIGGHNRRMRYGFATGASFVLARTDHGVNETRQEEVNWVRAVEWMDSIGVRLINTSLGYALGFTDPAENHKPSEIDGKTTLITRAAQIATEEKGLLIVVSAGNEGDDPAWRILSAPADAQGVLSVGATNEDGQKMNYSSTGPEWLPYNKPDVACYSLYGTSFSAPVITGLAACLFQYKPNAQGKEIRQAIEQSCHLYPYSNNFIGYGLPQADRAMALLDGKSVSEAKVVRSHGKNEYHLHVKGQRKAVLFHKVAGRIVKIQQTVNIQKGSIVIIRPEKSNLPPITQTTVSLAGSPAIEIMWE